MQRRKGVKTVSPVHHQPVPACERLTRANACCRRAIVTGTKHCPGFYSALATSQHQPVRG